MDVWYVAYWYPVSVGFPSLSSFRKIIDLSAAQLIRRIPLSENLHAVMEEEWSLMVWTRAKESLTSKMWIRRSRLAVAIKFVETGLFSIFVINSKEQPKET